MGGRRGHRCGGGGTGGVHGRRLGGRSGEKNGLSEEHAGEKMPKSTPTMAVVWWC